MRWSNERREVALASRSVAPPSRQLSRGRLVRTAGAFAAAVVLATTLLVSGAPDEKRVTIYSTAANYSLPVLERNGDEYVGLLEVFEPLGAVSAKAGGPHWKFRYNEVDNEFTAGKTRGEFVVDLVITKFPVRPARFGADCAQGLEDFEQANVFVAIALENREGVIGGSGVNGDAFFVRGAVEEEG